MRDPLEDKRLSLQGAIRIERVDVRDDQTEAACDGSRVLVTYAGAVAVPNCELVDEEAQALQKEVLNCGANPVSV